MDHEQAQIPPTITLAEAARRVGLSKDQCLRLHRAGRFVAIYRITKRDARVNPAELARWFESRRVEGAARAGAESIRNPDFEAERSALRSPRSA